MLLNVSFKSEMAVKCDPNALTSLLGVIEQSPILIKELVWAVKTVRRRK